MAEDNNALFHWPSTWKWHHKNNNDHGGSCLQNQRSQIARDTNTNSNSNNSANVSQGLGLRIKIKGPSPKAAPNNNDHGSCLQNQRSQIATDTNININSKTNQNGNANGSHGLRIKIIGPSPKAAPAAPINNSNNVQCHVCNQGFQSGKSLGGHMRMHSLSRKQDHKVRNRKVSSCVEKLSCYLCGKTFSSYKSLFGHMRVHPESVRKGTETPTFFDSSESLWGQSPTGKRSRRRDMGLEQGFQVDSLMQEAAYTLMLMSKGKNLGDKVASDHVDLVPPSTKKRRIEEKSLGMVGNEKGSFQSHSGDSDGRNNQIMDQFGSNLSKMQHYATAEEDTIRHGEGQNCNKTLTLMSKGNLVVGDEGKLANDHVDLLPPSMFPLTKKRRIEQKSLDEFGSNLSNPQKVGGTKAIEEDIIGHDQGQNCNKTLSVIGQGQANRAKTQSKEKGQNRFQIFIGHYDKPATMDKGKGIQPELLISASVMAPTNFGL